MNKNGNDKFFKKDNWKKILDKTLKDFRKNFYFNGYYETEKEKKLRIYRELINSKEIIENKIRSNVEYFAWPGGGYDKYSMKKAVESYKSITLSSRDRSDHRNGIGDDPSKIKRIGVPYIEHRGKIIS